MMRTACALALSLLAAACGVEGDARAPAAAGAPAVAAATAMRVSVAQADVTVAHAPAVAGVAVAAEPVSLAAVLDWLDPIDGRLTSPFGPRASDASFHDAVDVAAPIGTIVVAPADLRIRTIAYQARAGRYVIADVLDADGVVAWRLTFAHLSQVAVFEGDTVKRGEHIGLIGLSGTASGAHLHFRVEAVEADERIAVDPLAVLPSLGT